MGVYRCSSEIQAAHWRCAGREPVNFQAHALERGDEQIGQGIVVLAVKGQVLPMFEPAAGEERWKVSGNMGIGVTEIGAVKDHGAIQKRFTLVCLLQHKIGLRL
jgi:hypothetical protein